jgi:hypothetical protein
MKLERFLKGVAQVAALALLAASSPLAQKGESAHVAAKKAPVGRMAAKDSPTGSATAYGTPVARLRAVEGNVLVSQESGLSSAEESVVLVEGSRVITTAESTAIVVYRDGCEVKLEANQRLEIDADVPCAERIMLAHSIFEPAGAAIAASAGGATAAALGGSFSTVGLAAGTAGLAGLASLVEQRESSPASPS